MTIIDAYPFVPDGYIQIAFIIFNAIGTSCGIATVIFLLKEYSNIWLAIPAITLVFFFIVYAAMIFENPRVLAKIEEPTVEIFVQWEIKTVNDDGTVILQRK